MRVKRIFDGLTSNHVIDIMKQMLDDEYYTYMGDLRKDEYEWIIGIDVWERLVCGIQDFNIFLLYKDREDFYTIFDIEVTVSREKLNTIILRPKNERRNEMPFEKSYHIDYSSILFKSPEYKLPNIKNVIFNNPATIVIWGDGSKTVVKCQDGEIYDPEKGLAMAISKKALGNKGNYCKVFKKWLPEEEESDEEPTVTLKVDTEDFNKTLSDLADALFSKKEK